MSGKPKYVITQYSRDKIQELNEKLNTSAFSIKLSEDPSKKIDVFLREKKITSIPDIKDGAITPMFWARWILW